ncbi:hypothetical protein DFH09DRAFT_1099855 [Mycena vulgaris]|nr:hypothetical protein DFH09DRAFT_1099855 [Mycena vulgaris]
MVTEYSADPFARRAYQRPWRRERPTSAPPVVKIPPSDAGIPASEERLLYVQRRKAHPSRWRHRYLPRKTLAGPTSRPPPISHTQTVRMKEARAQWGSGATRALIASHSPIASDARGKDSKVDTRGDDDSTLIPADGASPGIRHRDKDETQYSWAPRSSASSLPRHGTVRRPRAATDAPPGLLRRAADGAVGGIGNRPEDQRKGGENGKREEDGGQEQQAPTSVTSHHHQSLPIGQSNQPRVSDFE